MEKSNKRLNVLVIVLMVLVICLSGFIVYDKVLNKKEDNNVVDNTNTSNDTQDADGLIGLYSAKLKVNNDFADVNEGVEEGEEYQIDLYFSEDWTYCEKELSVVSSTRCGNYYIKNNKLYLNSIIHVGSGTGILASEVVRILDIKDGNLIDSNYSNRYTNDKEVTYKKGETSDFNEKMKDLIISTTESSANLLINSKL